MNSYAAEPDPSHGDLLADRLRRLDNLDDQSVQAPSSQIPPTPLPNIAYRDGYGFRPPSGVTSPCAPPADRNSPLPDVNGLGWPGRSSLLLVIPIPLTPLLSKGYPLSSQRFSRRECGSPDQTRRGGAHRPRMHRRGS